MKKFFAVILAICLIVSVFSTMMVNAAQSGVVGSCSWQLNGTELIISGNGDMGYSAYWPWGKNITELTIGEGVTSVGLGAFENCTALKNVTLPNSLKTIEKFAFYGCSSLSEITIPDNVILIGMAAFSDCEKIEQINIPSKVTDIEMGVFDNCYSLNNITVAESNPNYVSLDGVLFNKSKTILIKYPNSRTQHAYTIPDTVTRIEHSAFLDAYYLSDITIPDTVTYIGINPFHGTPYYNKKSNFVDGILYLGKHIIAVDENAESFEIRKDTKTIADGAFAFCEEIKEIVIPDGVVTIGGNAFAWCSSLEKIYIPKSVTRIGESAFYDCNINEIYYSGNATDKNNVYFERYNDELKNANWNYNACFNSPLHTWQSEVLNNVTIKKCDVCECEVKISNGWLLDGSTWEFYENGQMVIGWKFIDSNWYYFNENGKMVTGWQTIGCAWYYFNASGAMATGWVNDGGVWYYMNSSGDMATGWVYDGSAWYYMNASGAMATGWVKDGDAWYYMSSSGAMATGWIYDGNWYYANSSGIMLTGWQLIDGTWYYFYSSGAMASNCLIDGYRINASGAWV